MKNLLLLFLIGILVHCTPLEQGTIDQQQASDPYLEIEDEKAREIVRAGIAAAGGLDRWKSIQSLQYKKVFSLLYSDGTAEKSYDQWHTYRFSPLRIHIRSQEDSVLVETLQEGNAYSRTIDGAPADIPATQLAKSINSSIYVIGIPFKLLDPGARISYEGRVQLEDGREADVLKVQYDAAQNDNHSSSETWKYYFDVESKLVVRNWIESSDHLNIVDNLSFARVEGLVFHEHRKSYRLDSLGQKDYLRAEYHYGDYTISFKEY